MIEQAPKYDVDVAILSDFRLPGGTTSSIAEEVRAQSAAGISTALVHIAGSVTNYALGFSHHIRRVTGLPHVQLATAHSQVRTKLIIIRHPTVILSTRHRLARISGDRVLIVANHAAIDAAGTQHYDIAAVDAKVRDLFGTEPMWAPIGPVVRGTMLQQTKEVPFQQQDWVNIFTIPEGTDARTGFLENKPVIGRHSRPQPGKWPSTGRDILAAYPDSEQYRIRVLGGADVAEKLVGYVPANWEVIPFGGEDPAVFLQEVDFWVYMHHPDLKEAFGRAAMEALAAGCVAIMPPYMEELFGDAALYAKPHQVVALVDEYYADLQKFLAQSQRAQEFARGFSPQMHIHRLRQLGVDSAATAAAVSPVRAVTEDSAPRKNLRSLVVIHGEPGKQRLAEYADAAGQNPHLVLVALGAEPWEGLPATQSVHIPTASRLNMQREVWEDYMGQRVRHLVESVEPSRIGYEGVLPPTALTAALTETTAEKAWLRHRPSSDQEDDDATGEAQVAAEGLFHIVADAAGTRVQTLFTSTPEGSAA